MIFFIDALALSGITAFLIQTELEIAMRDLHWFPKFNQIWLLQVEVGVKFVNNNYPFISYGTNWLAFAYLIIAIVFIKPFKIFG